MANDEKDTVRAPAALAAILAEVAAITPEELEEYRATREDIYPNEIPIGKATGLLLNMFALFWLKEKALETHHAESKKALRKNEVRLAANLNADAFKAQMEKNFIGNMISGTAALEFLLWRYGAPAIVSLRKNDMLVLSIAPQVPSYDPMEDIGDDEGSEDDEPQEATDAEGTPIPPLKKRH